MIIITTIVIWYNYNNNIFQNAVTHKDATNKVKVELQWEAPSDFQGDVAFMWVKFLYFHFLLKIYKWIVIAI